MCNARYLGRVMQRERGTYYDSNAADALFSEINSAEPDVVISSLSFLMKDTDKEKVLNFEYDTDLNHAWYLLGSAFEKLGRLESAASCFKRAAEIWPEDSEAFLAYSNTENSLQKQIPFLEWGCSVNDDMRIKFNLANALIDNGEKNRALEILLLIPDDVDFHEDLARARKLANKGM